MTKKQKQFRPVTNAALYWCLACNVPLIEKNCMLCGTKGKPVALGPPGDVRFCSRFERSILHDILVGQFNTDPLGERIILLNKIGGEDKTDQVILDGMIFGVLRYDLKILNWRLDLSMEGGAILAEHTDCRTVELSDIPGHLSGKTVGSDRVLSYSHDIKPGDTVIIKKGTLFGTGIATQKNEKVSFRIKKIGSSPSRLNDSIPSMDEVIQANEPAIKQLGKNAMNTIRGIANQKEFRGRPVYVSFSGGKDSLAVLDLTQSALRGDVNAYFINTGLEFPETVEYVRQFCIKNDILLQELDAGDAFEQNLPDFGPPAKDYRWCCKVCKLSPASRLDEEGTYLTIDGKRSFESFSRARIPPKEENPFVPGQVNIYPVRHWRAIEVWLYIYWRGLEYNPLYDLGFERIGCWLCPAALTAEYERMETLHPELYRKWDRYLHEWAAARGLSRAYIDHGFWRWREHPPKMKLMAEHLRISLIPEEAEHGTFQIKMMSGLSPCRAGGYSMEGYTRGVHLHDAAQTMKTLGDVYISDDLGVLITRTSEGSIKLFLDGTIQINARDEESAGRLFNEAARQLIRSARCTGCCICEKTCPRNAITVEHHHIRVNDRCDRCGKCTKVCVAVRYLDTMGMIQNLKK